MNNKRTTKEKKVQCDNLEVNEKKKTGEKYKKKVNRSMHDNLDDEKRTSKKEGNKRKIEKRNNLDVNKKRVDK